MDEDDVLLVEPVSGILQLRLNRPAVLNALNTAVYRSLGRCLDDVWDRTDAHALVLTGAGRAFSVGADLTERQRMAEAELFARRELVPRVLHRLENLPIPTVAAVHGYALGGGLELALACDFRILAEDAVLQLPEVKLGVIPAAGGTVRLARLVGPERAKELIFTARKLSGAEAVGLGLASQASSPGKLDAAVAEITDRLAAISPVALRQAKKSINFGLGAADQGPTLFEAEAYTRAYLAKTDGWERSES